MSNKPWRCRIGMHQFVVLWTDDNHRYRRCRRCGKDHAGSTDSPARSLRTPRWVGNPPAKSHPRFDRVNETNRQPLTIFYIAQEAPRLVPHRHVQPLARTELVEPRHQLGDDLRVHDFHDAEGVVCTVRGGDTCSNAGA